MKKRKIQLSDPEQIRILSLKLECPERILRDCLVKVGASEPAIELYWAMNKDRLLWQDSLSTASIAG